MTEGIRGWEGCGIESGGEVNIYLASSSNGKQEEELEGRGGKQRGGRGRVARGEKDGNIITSEVKPLEVF